jgi:hypothetical protein
VKQNTTRWLDTQTLEYLRVLHREFDHLADALNFLLKTADVLVRHTACVRLDSVRRLFTQNDFRVLCDHDGSVGFSLSSDERYSLTR